MKTKILRGFRDYMPEEMLAKQRMLDKVASVFESFGYPPIQTPALEYSEVLLGKSGDEADMLMYRFLDNGKRDVCMRYDLTVPLARVVADHGNLAMPFRRYQIAPVWRAEKPARGRYREFMQCDVDLVGADEPAADAEIIMVGVEVLRALGIQDFQLRINHRGVLRGMTRTFGIADGAQETQFLRLLDKLPKIGQEKFRALAKEEFSFDDASLDRLLDFVRMSDDAQETLSRMEAVVAEDPDGAAGLERLRAVMELVTAAGGADNVRIDPSIARGLSYYTGLIYETFLDALPEIGSVMSGGRYDKLVGIFSKRDLPAAGISLGVDRLFAALEELAPQTVRPTPAQVLVVQFSEATAAHTMRVASEFRQAGVPTLIYPAAAKLKKQFQYANSMGVPWTAVVGDAEAAAGEINLKNMDTGEQTQLSIADAVAKIRAGTE